MDVAAARTALAPLCRALRDDAGEETGRRLADADADTAHLLSDAHTTAADILARARAAGIADGAAELAARRARQRQAARTGELRAQQDTYRELRRQVVARIAAWCARPETRSLLAERVRTVLGEDATVTDARNGGVIGTAGGRRLDLDVDTIAATAIETLGGDLARLWSP